MNPIYDHRQASMSLVATFGLTGRLVDKIAGKSVMEAICHEKKSDCGSFTLKAVLL